MNPSALQLGRPINFHAPQSAQKTPEKRGAGEIHRAEVHPKGPRGSLGSGGIRTACGGWAWKCWKVDREVGYIPLSLDDHGE